MKYRILDGVPLVVVLLFCQTTLAGQDGLAAQSPEWRCETERKWECQLPFGCEELDPTRVWVDINFSEGTYQRCDDGGCDAYRITVTERGLFTYIRLDEHPDTFMKIGLASYFVEVATRGISPINSFGVCRPSN